MEKDMTNEFDHLAIMTQVNKTYHMKSVFDQILDSIAYRYFSFKKNICSNPLVFSINMQVMNVI